MMVVVVAYNKKLYFEIPSKYIKNNVVFVLIYHDHNL